MTYIKKYVLTSGLSGSQVLSLALFFLVSVAGFYPLDLHSFPWCRTHDFYDSKLLLELDIILASTGPEWGGEGTGRPPAALCVPASGRLPVLW